MPQIKSSKTTTFSLSNLIFGIFLHPWQRKSHVFGVFFVLLKKKNLYSHLPKSPVIVSFNRVTPLIFRHFQEKWAANQFFLRCSLNCAIILHTAGANFCKIMKCHNYKQNYLLTFKKQINSKQEHWLPNKCWKKEICLSLMRPVSHFLFYGQDVSL